MFLTVLDPPLELSSSCRSEGLGGYEETHSEPDNAERCQDGYCRLVKTIRLFAAVGFARLASTVSFGQKQHCRAAGQPVRSS